MNQRKAAAARVSVVKGASDLIVFQREMLEKVADLRVELERFNQTVITKKLSVYQV